MITLSSVQRVCITWYSYSTSISLEKDSFWNVTVRRSFYATIPERPKFANWGYLFYRHSETQRIHKKIEYNMYCKIPQLQLVN